MHILILGAGALGSLLAARLSGTDAKITLLGVNREHIEAILEHGLVVEELDGSLTRHHPVCHDNPNAVEEKADLVIVAVKAYATQRAVFDLMDHCRPSTLFLTLQNGIGNWESIARIVGADRVSVGITAQGSTLLEPGRIRHGGNGATFIGEPSGPPTKRIYSLMEIFLKAGLDAKAGECMEDLIWHKLLINIGINAITALTGIRNGMIAEIKPASELSRAAVEEAALVAQAKGIRIANDIVQRVLAVAQATAVNRSSMGQDVDRRKRTEIDAINGAIVRFGEQLNIPTPVNRTLTQLIKIMEAR